MTRKKTTEYDLTLVGYARVSTAEQSLDMQTNALRKYGVSPKRIYSENISGVKRKRPQLDAALRALRKGDTLVVWKLDRIARSFQHLLNVINELEERGVDFRSITEELDTKTPGGKMVFHVMGAMAEFERDLIRERSIAGVKRAQERGVRFGAKPKIEESEMPKIWKRVREKREPMSKVAKEYDVSPQTIWRRLKEYEKSNKK